MFYLSNVQMLQLPISLPHLHITSPIPQLTILTTKKAAAHNWTTATSLTQLKCFNLYMV